MKASPTLLGLLEHYSPSGQEQEAVAFLVEQMQASGFSQAYVDEAGNAIGIMGAGEQQIILLGHIDTVPGEIDIREEGELLYGRGSVDAKGPLAAFVDAVVKVGERPEYQFVVIGAVEEERDSLGARHITDKYQPIATIIGEPSAWDRITLGYKGSAWAKLTARADNAHTASQNHTVAELAVQNWQRIQAWAAEFNADRQAVFEQLSPKLIHMNSQADGFEDRASLEINFRLPTDLPPDALYRQLGEVLQDCAVEESGYPIPAYLAGKNNPLVRAFLQAIRAEGGDPRFVRKTGTADMNIVANEWNCPILAYGPGDSTLDHTPNEHISLVEYERAVKVLTYVLQAL